MSIFTQQTHPNRITNKCNNHNNNGHITRVISHNDVPKYIEDDIKNGRVNYVNLLRHINFKSPSFQIKATEWIRACLDNFIKNPPIYRLYLIKLIESLINSIGIDKTIHGLTKPWMSYDNIDNEWSFLHMICSKNLLQTFKSILTLLKNHHAKLILSTPSIYSSSKCKISPLYCCIANGHKLFTAYLFDYYHKNLKSADIARILNNETPSHSSNSLVMHLINYNHQQTLQQLLNEDRKRSPQTFLTQQQVQLISIQINSGSSNKLFRKIEATNNTSIRPIVQTAHIQPMVPIKTAIKIDVAQSANKTQRRDRKECCDYDVSTIITHLHPTLQHNKDYKKQLERYLEGVKQSCKKYFISSFAKDFPFKFKGSIIIYSVLSQLNNTQSIVEITENIPSNILLNIAEYGVSDGYIQCNWCGYDLYLVVEDGWFDKYNNWGQYSGEFADAVDRVDPKSGEWDTSPYHGGGGAQCTQCTAEMYEEYGCKECGELMDHEDDFHQCDKCGQDQLCEDCVDNHSDCKQESINNDD